MIVIAHRFSTVRRTDAIQVVDDGRIVENGKHDDLLAAGGLYARRLTAAGQRGTDKSEPFRFRATSLMQRGKLLRSSVLHVVPQPRFRRFACLGIASRRGLCLGTWNQQFR